MSEWISMKDKRPKEREEVLLLWNTLKHMENGWIDDGVYVLFDGQSMNSLPTHWMPLPAPPKAEGKQP